MILVLWSPCHCSMSFSPGMSSIPRVTSKMKSVRIDSEEGIGDSGDVDQEEG